MKKLSPKPFAALIGTAFALGSVGAQASVFQASDLASGYMVASAADAKTDTAPAKKGEAKCGEKKSEHQCGEKKTEGKCGEKKAEGKCGEKKAEGKCGEAKCGANKK